MSSLKRKKQRTLFSGPGGVRANIRDKRNRVHYVPLDTNTIEAIKGNTNVVSVDSVYPKCGQTFTNKQGLGGHLIQ